LLRGSSGFGLMSLGGEVSKRTGWGREFEDPIVLPDGRVLVTLRDAATHITNLPKKESAVLEWQTAISELMLAVERNRPTILARIGFMQALNRHKVREFNPNRKDPHWGPAQAEERPTTVFVYVNTSRQVGDAEHIKVFANQDAAEKWFEENDPEGVAFEYEVFD
jgi:hypothetical protein